MPPWTQEEDEKLKKAIRMFGKENWKDIEEAVATHSAHDCRDRCNQLEIARMVVNKQAKSARQSTKSKQSTKSIRWTPEEDSILYNKVHELKHSWAKISECIPGRTEMACQARWKIIKNYQHHENTSSFKYNMSFDALLYQEHSLHPNDWPFLAQFFALSEEKVKSRYEYITSHPAWSDQEDSYLMKNQFVFPKDPKRILDVMPYRSYEEIQERISELSGELWTMEDEDLLLKQDREKVPFSIPGHHLPSILSRLSVIKKSEESEWTPKELSYFTDNSSFESIRKILHYRSARSILEKWKSSKEESPPIVRIYLQHRNEWSSFLEQLSPETRSSYEEQLNSIQYAPLSLAELSKLDDFLLKNGFEWGQTDSLFIQSPSELYRQWNASYGFRNVIKSKKDAQNFAICFLEHRTQWSKYSKFFNNSRDVLMTWQEISTGWSHEDDLILDRVAISIGKPDWQTISTLIGRSESEAKLRWMTMHPGILPTSWSALETQQLRQQFEDYKFDWIKYSIPGRSFEDVRTRAIAYYKPSNNSPWTLEEDAVFVRASKYFNKQVSEIYSIFPHRKPAAILSRYYQLSFDPPKFTPDEDYLMWSLYRVFGKCTECIAGFFNKVSKMQIRERVKQLVENPPYPENPGAEWDENWDKMLIKLYADNNCAALSPLFPGKKTCDLDERVIFLTKQLRQGQNQPPASMVPRPKMPAKKMLPAKKKVMVQEWTDDQLALLKEIVSSAVNWSAVADSFPGYSETEIEAVWRRDSKKKEFSPDEDRIMQSHVEVFGCEWAKYAPFLPERSYNEIAARGQQLYDAVQKLKSTWSMEEIDLLEKAVQMYGFNWDLVAEKIEGRTAEDAKREYYRKHKDSGILYDCKCMNGFIPL